MPANEPVLRNGCVASSEATEALSLMQEGHPPVVVVDPDILGGTPCLAGSRLPAKTLVACADKNDWGRVLESWPWLTPAHVDAARVWLASSSPASR